MYHGHGVYDGILCGLETDGQQQYQQSQQQYQQNYQQEKPQVPEQQQQAQTQQQIAYQQQQLQQKQQPQQQQKVAAELPMEESAADQQDAEFVNEKGKPLFKRIFGDRKKSSVRLREKKIRQNRRLRKAITPKNALMALNEVKGIEMSDFTVNSNPSGGFLAIVTINSSEYEGRGPSKAAAKNNACEKALRDYVIERMINKPRLSKTNSESSVVPMDVAETAENGNGETSKDAATDDDDVPMVNLASFALFKLFSEWESEGFVIPEMHRTATNGTEATAANGANGAAVPSEPKKTPPIRTELPPNYETMHPATLLCMMRPGVQYQSVGATGEKPNEVQNMTVTVDEQEFKGSGRSKKIARRNAAVSVCNTLFGTAFTLEGGETKND